MSAVIPAGIVNVGNSCYLSSVVQLLAADDSFIEHFKAEEGGRGGSGRIEIANELSSLLKDINFSGKSVVNPEKFIQSFTQGSFLSTQQQDAHEFLLALLNLKQPKRRKLEDFGLKSLDDFETEKQKSKEFKLIKPRDCFTGVQLNELICVPCATVKRLKHTSSLKIETFSCLTVPSNEPLNEAVNRQLFSVERIDDYLNCGGCGLGAINQKRTLHLPPFLFLNVSLLTSSALSKSFNSSTRLQLKLKVQNSVYRLIAMIVHFGSTGHSGHFVCYRRGRKGQWIECNDARIRIVKEEAVRCQMPYILLYRRLFCKNITEQIN